MLKHDERQKLIQEYIDHGFRITRVGIASKSPTSKNWNIDGNWIRRADDIPKDSNLGILHLFSRTACIDVDNIVAAKEKGLPLDMLLNATDSVIIRTNSENRTKLLYRVPFGFALPTKVVKHEKGVAYELRCASADGKKSVQDLLPPSVHPKTGITYKWDGNGDWRNLPLLPTAVFQIWSELATVTPDVRSIPAEKYNTSWREIECALDCLSPDCDYDTWIKLGMAVHSAADSSDDHEQGFEIWHEWSRKSEDKYQNERSMRAHYNSFRSNPDLEQITIGTLFHLAAQEGWRRPIPDIGHLFIDTPEPTVKPNTLMTSLTIQPPKIDLEIFPDILKRRADHVSRQIGCDPLAPAFAGLAAICGVADATARLKLLPGFEVPPILWLMTIGNPALKKTPASKPFFKIFSDLQDEDKPRFIKAKLEYEALEASYSSAKKIMLDYASSPDFLLDGDLPFVPDEPTPPAPLRIVVEDITSQKLVRVCSENSRGVLCYLDEMNSWVKKMTASVSGEDRSCWVMSYESNPYVMDRVGSGTIEADNMSVSIFGNIQPRIFNNALKTLASDGMLQRFIPAILRDKDWGIGYPSEDTKSQDEWNTLIRKVFSSKHKSYTLSDEAYALFRNFQTWYNDYKNDLSLINTNDVFLTAFGKLEGTCGRVCFIFHLMENSESSIVKKSTLERAIRFIREYVLPAYKYAFDQHSDERIYSKFLCEYIIQKSDCESLTMSDIKNASSKFLMMLPPYEQNRIILMGMSEAENAKWVIRMDDGSNEYKGQAEWAIDPRLKDMFANYRKAIVIAKQKEIDSLKTNLSDNFLLKEFMELFD